MDLIDYAKGIESIDESERKFYRDHWDSLVHITGGLGELEEIGIKVCSILGELPENVDKKVSFVMCSDNGITEENISSSPKIFTKLLAEEMIFSGTAMHALSTSAGADLAIVDLGILDFDGMDGIIDRRISNDTKNFDKEDAMTYDQALEAIGVGIELAEAYIDDGYKIIGTGELGIGNTTTAAAVIRCLTGASEKEVVGLGSGVDNSQLENKLRVVRDCMEKRNTDPEDPVGVLAKVGGYDIGAIAGVYLACGKNKVVGVIDGVITAAAALLAYRINPNVKDYLIGSHIAKEKASKIVLDEIGIPAYLDLSMRLGEGTGCPLVFKLIDSSISCMNNMVRFEDSKLRNTLVNIRDI